MGAARTRIVYVGDARRWNEPSAVMTTAAEPPRILAVGAEAGAAVERTPDNIRVRRPQMAGRIAEPDLVEKQLAFWLQKCLGRVFLPVVRPRLTLTVPCGAMEWPEGQVRRAKLG